MDTKQKMQKETEMMQFDGTNHGAVMDFMDGHSGAEGESFLMGDTIYISSNNGMITGGIGDYVAKTQDGEISLHVEQKDNKNPSTTERWLTVICCLLISGFLFGVGFVIAFRLLLL